MNDMMSEYAEIAPAFLAFLDKKKEALTQKIAKLKKQEKEEPETDKAAETAEKE